MSFKSKGLYVVYSFRLTDPIATRPTLAMAKQDAREHAKRPLRWTWQEIGDKRTYYSDDDYRIEVEAAS